MLVFSCDPIFQGETIYDSDDVDDASKAPAGRLMLSLVMPSSVNVAHINIDLYRGDNAYGTLVDSVTLDANATETVFE
jgi:hypothetical protein